MGAIYKRGKVFWLKYYRNGQPFRESAHTEKESEAKRLLRLREGQVAEGRFPGLKVERIRFDELAEDYLTDYRVNAKKSLNRAERSVKQLKKHFGGIRVVDITTSRVTAHISSRQQEGAANATINRELAALKRLLSLGAKHTPPKVLNRPYIPLLKENNARTGFFERAEFLALRDALPHEIKAVATLAYFSGWRKQEILGLQWGQVDLINRTATLEVGTTKNGQGRILFLNNELHPLLVLQRQATPPGCPWVFHRDGERIKDFRGGWAKACGQAKLGERLFHDFRRTAIRNMVRAGIPERVAMEVSGHKTRSVFERYNIVNEADLRKAADRLFDYHQNAAGTISGTIDTTDTPTPSNPQQIIQ
jgi:integrase